MMKDAYIAEAKGSPGCIADQAVKVSGCDVLDGKAFQGCEFVGYVEGALWSCLPCEACEAELASPRVVLGPRGKGKYATGGSQHQCMLQAGRDLSDALVPGEVLGSAETVGDVV